MNELAILGGGAISKCVMREMEGIITYHDPLFEVDAKYILICKGYRESAFSNNQEVIDKSKFLNCDIIKTVQKANRKSKLIFLSSYFIYQGMEQAQEEQASWPDSVPSGASIYTRHKLEGEAINKVGYNLRIGKFIDFSGQECRTLNLLKQDKLTVDRVKFPYCSNIKFSQVIKAIMSDELKKGTYNCCDGTTSYYELAQEYCTPKTEITVVDRFHDFNKYSDIIMDTEKLDKEKKNG